MNLTDSKVSSALRLPGMVSVHARPASVLTRELPGDWEGDLIKGAGNASCIGTLAERKTRYVILTKMKDASADAALAGFSRGLSRVPQAMRTSISQKDLHLLLVNNILL